jgi:serine/threonine-protein kinase
MGYRKLRRLGAGHFGEVWLEHDDALDRPCAAKYLNPANLLSVVDVYAEAQAMMAAQHDNVVTVYSADDLQGTPVIRMEYLPDGSVEDRYKGLPVPVREGVRIMEEACRGLEHLHLSGLLHRDVKPANLLLTSGDGVKVSDFGLSCKSSEVSQAVPLAYMLHIPPEAVSTGEGITTPTGDVYAAGVTAYRLVNGDAMLSMAATTDLEAAIAAGRYPDRKLWQPHVHPKLRRVIVKALHVDPGKRYPSASAFRRALEQARPAVSWKMTPGVEHWDGEGPDGSSWRAEVVKRRGGFRFEVARRLPGRGWRRLAADERDGNSPAELLPHAEQALGRVAENGR